MPKGATETMESWVPGAGVGLLGTFLAWLTSWRVATAKAEGRTGAQLQATKELREADSLRASELRQDLRDFRDDWRRGIEEVRRYANTMVELQSTQHVFNDLTTKSMDSMTLRLERHEAAIADQAASIRLLTEVYMRDRHNVED